MKKTTIAAVSALLLLLAAPAMAQETAELSALNDSGASSQAEMTLDGTSLTVTITGTGFAAGLVHAQHIHFAPGTDSTCPGADADGDGDGLISTVEGVPFYGGVQFSLTTEGDFTGDSGLAIDRFPTADDEGNLDYERTFELDQAMVDSLTGQQFALVQHGIDIDGSGEYDGDAVSSLDPELPLEATIPAVCGVVTLQAASDDTTTTTAAGGDTTTTAAGDAAPAGGADTGAGGAADGGIGGAGLAIALFGALAIGAGGYVAMRRTNHES
ncbi:MAG: hypothetical protein WD156_06050 [Acidimicrobiia bacterium]